MMRIVSLMDPVPAGQPLSLLDRKSTRLNSSHTVIYTLSLHDALPISAHLSDITRPAETILNYDADSFTHGSSAGGSAPFASRSEEHTSELQSHRDLHSFPTRRSSDLSSFVGHHPSGGNNLEL